jgi:chemotaxis protein methyltransferase CheR
MRVSDYDVYREMLRETMGLALSPQQAFLVDARLTPVARKWGYANLQSLAVALRAVPEPELLDDVAEAMANTETCFFRDETPFADLTEVAIPALLRSRARQRRLRIWSCGCGTGQEAWSIAMAIKNMRPPLNGWKIDILGTDISPAAIETAANATYAQYEIQTGLPIADTLAWCEPVGRQWRMKDALRRMARFEVMNLSLDALPPPRSFDLVFFRNVMDNFEPGLRAEILESVSETVADDGFLILGPAENPAGLYDGLMPLPDRPGLFVIAEQDEPA